MASVGNTIIYIINPVRDNEFMNFSKRLSPTPFLPELLGKTCLLADLYQAFGVEDVWCHHLNLVPSL